MSECLVVGGGVVGLSIAYELAGRGRRVRVIDAAQPGREASWAGAGILPPAGSHSDEPLEQLAALSNRLHAQWWEHLRDDTGIDNGFRRSGAIYLARSATEARALQTLASVAHRRHIVVEPLSQESLREIEPAVRPRGGLEAAYYAPTECQIRNPRHLKALLVGCAQRGVEVLPGTPAEDFEIRDGRIEVVVTPAGRLSADTVCITTGAWSGALARKLGLTLEIKPIRGQILLLSQPRPVLSHIINESSRYLVPRPDGRVLVGSTEDDVGFDRSTTAQGAGDLLHFALGLVPELGNSQLERSWAGLRPATVDGMPYLGRVPSLDNAFIAAGHFRGGLQLSTGTAVVMSQLIDGETPEVDLSVFRVDRLSHDSPAPQASKTRPAVSLG